MLLVPIDFPVNVVVLLSGMTQTMFGAVRVLGGVHLFPDYPRNVQHADHKCFRSLRETPISRFMLTSGVLYALMTLNYALSCMFSR